jgi:hypothetical protein
MTWLPTLATSTPEEGYNLAIKLSRMAVKITQPDDAIRTDLREVYGTDAQALIAVSHVVAVHFQTISQANDYWKATQ